MNDTVICRKISKARFILSISIMLSAIPESTSILSSASIPRMLSHTFRPRAQAAPPPVVGLIRNRGPAATASLNIVTTPATAFRRATQNTAILVSGVGGEQDEEISIVPPQVQESQAGMPILSGGESGNEHQLANTEPSM